MSVTSHGTYNCATPAVHKHLQFDGITVSLMETLMKEMVSMEAIMQTGDKLGYWWSTEAVTAYLRTTRISLSHLLHLHQGSRSAPSSTRSCDSSFMVA